MKKHVLIALVSFYIFFFATYASAQEYQLYFKPFLSVNRNLYQSNDNFSYNTSGSEIDFHSRNAKFIQSDDVSVGLELNLHSFYTSLTYSYLYDNNYNNDSDHLTDFNIGYRYRDLLFYMGQVLNVSHYDRYLSYYDISMATYFGFRSKFDIAYVNLVNDLQCKFNGFNDDMDYYGISATSRVYYPMRYVKPYLYFGLEYWNLGQFEQDKLTDNTAFSFGVGMDFGNLSSVGCESIKVIGPLLSKVRKPNIYLYPTEKCNVNVKVYPNGKITESIPEYDNGWRVQANPDGTIPGTEGFLFYEADVSYDMPKAGKCVKYDQVISFSVATLKHYGFNDREITDFVEYWTKALEYSLYYAIYPMINAEIEEICPIEITPHPDNIIRLWFVFEARDEFIVLPEYESTVMSRDGYVVTEWGGMIIE